MQATLKRLCQVCLATVKESAVHPNPPKSMQKNPDCQSMPNLARRTLHHALSCRVGFGGWQVVPPVQTSLKHCPQAGFQRPAHEEWPKLPALASPTTHRGFPFNTCLRRHVVKLPACFLDLYIYICIFIYLWFHFYYVTLMTFRILPRVSSATLAVRFPGPALRALRDQLRRCPWVELKLGPEPQALRDPRVRGQKSGKPTLGLPPAR